MKKDDLIAAVNEVRQGLESDSITQAFFQALNAKNTGDQAAFSEEILRWLVTGAASFRRFSQHARSVCDLLQTSTYYDAGISDTVHHFAKAKGKLSPHPEKPEHFRENFLNIPETIFFIAAHQGVISCSKILNELLKADRPTGELLLEGSVSEGGPALEQMESVLKTIRELVDAYLECEGAQDENGRIEVSYLDLGSNYQIGVKVDGKAEMGPNLAKFLTEALRWITNPRAYFRQQRADEILKHTEVIATLQRRVDAREITAQTANQLAARLLGCTKELAQQHVLPAAFIREQAEVPPARRVLELVDEIRDQGLSETPKLVVLQDQQPNDVPKNLEDGGK